MQARQPSPFCGNLENSHIVVTGWDDGTTERGSSGCSLFNSDQNIVGILSGGSASCPDGQGFDLFGKLEVAFRHGLGDHISSNPGEVSMRGRWHVDPKSTLMFRPESLAMMENGPSTEIAVWLSEPVERDDVVVVSVSVPKEVEHLIETLEPRELRYTSGDWHEQKKVRIKPRDNADFGGDVRYYLHFNVEHGYGQRETSSYTSQYPVIHQDDEHISGDTLFDAIAIKRLPFTFLGDTSSGYTNTYQSRCELGSASPDVVFEYTPERDTYVSISLCSLQLFDSTLYILENGQEKWCNDDGDKCAPSSELTTLLFQSEKTYHIVVDGYNGAMGRFQLQVDEVLQYVNSFEGGDIPSDTYSHLPMDTYMDTYKSDISSSSQPSADKTYGMVVGLAPIASLQTMKEPEDKSSESFSMLSRSSEARDDDSQVQSLRTFFNVLESSNTADSKSKAESSSFSSHTKSVVGLTALLLLSFLCL